MTNITSEKRSVNYSDKDIFTFIGDFKNFQSLLPEDRVENFVASSENCSFRIKGMTDLGLRIDNKEEFSKIKMKSDGKVPFNFSMDVNIVSAGENQSEVFIEFAGDINPFMSMMIEKPLTNFFNMLVDKLATLKLEQFL
jgi:hypothetical protein